MLQGAEPVHAEPTLPGMVGAELVRAEAVVIDWEEALTVVDVATLWSRVVAMRAAGLQVVLVTRQGLDQGWAGLGQGRSGPGRVLLLEEEAAQVVELTVAGPRAVPGAGCPEEAADRRAGGRPSSTVDGEAAWRSLGCWLAAQGISGQLVMVVGDTLLAGRRGVRHLAAARLRRAVVVPVRPPDGDLASGKGGLLERIDAQLAARRQGRVPSIDEDSRWVLALAPGRQPEHVRSALVSLGNGQLATTASCEAGYGRAPSVTTMGLLVSGVYTAGGADTRLLPGPCWCILAGAPLTWRLDLRTGTLLGTGGGGHPFRVVLLVSAARPSAMALRVEGPTPQLERLGPAERPDAATAFDAVRAGEADVARTFDPLGGGIALACVDHWSDLKGLRCGERLAAVAWEARGRARRATARARLARLEAAGFDQLLAEHRGAWAGRWADAEVAIEGSAEDELAVRFALFHLLSAGPEHGEAAVGARGLTGGAYGGHVFWDADVFVLPVLAALRPAMARAMLEYRLRRLPAARAAARERHYRGARFAWESAADGTDVTPRVVPGPGGRPVAILTGEHEEHLVADVAWAALEYAAWSGDRGFVAGAGAPLVCETARYWASRIRVDDAGRGHLYGVIGPDEYHEIVDDNTFTNVMARWNLRVAAELAAGDPAAGVAVGEARQWRQLADGLVDGYDRHVGRHEQFAGYWRLEPLLAADVGEPPFAADVVLGAERVRASQLIKQADVLMAHHLVPGELAAGSLVRDLAFYEPRTVHGSSLSPAVHAALLARAGAPERALQLFRLAARLDLDDLTGTTAGGLHLATFGGLWQALAYGFLGLRPQRGVLELDPRLPSAWEAVSVRFRFEGAPLAVRADHDRVRVSCSRPVAVRQPDGSVRTFAPPGRSIVLERTVR